MAKSIVFYYPKDWENPNFHQYIKRLVVMTLYRKFYPLFVQYNQAGLLEEVVHEIYFWVVSRFKKDFERGKMPNGEITRGYLINNIRWRILRLISLPKYYRDHSALIWPLYRQSISKFSYSKNEYERDLEEIELEKDLEDFPLLKEYLQGWTFREMAERRNLDWRQIQYRIKKEITKFREYYDQSQVHA